MSSTEAKRCVNLKFFGHLAEDQEGSEISLILTNSPSVVSLDGVDVPCMAYFNGRRGLVCYINDGDANSIARHHFNQTAIAV